VTRQAKLLLAGTGPAGPASLGEREIQRLWDEPNNIQQSLKGLLRKASSWV